MLKQKKKSVFIRLIISLLVVSGGLFLVAWHYLQPHITKNINLNLMSVIEQSGYSNISLEQNGLDITLIGELEDQSSIDKLSAIVSEVEGVRNVDNQVILIGALKPANLEADNTLLTDQAIVKDELHDAEKQLDAPPLAKAEEATDALDALNELPTIDDLDLSSDLQPNQLDKHSNPLIKKIKPQTDALANNQAIKITDKPSKIRISDTETDKASKVRISDSETDKASKIRMSKNETDKASKVRISKNETDKANQVSISKSEKVVKKRVISMPKGYEALLKAMTEHDALKKEKKLLSVDKHKKIEKPKEDSQFAKGIRRISTNTVLNRESDDNTLESSSFYGVSLNKIQFKDNSYQLDLNSELVLSEVAAKIKEMASMDSSFEVIVYASESKLAMQRAVSICEWLFDVGVKSKQLIPKGVYKENHSNQVFIKSIK